MNRLAFPSYFTINLISSVVFFFGSRNFVPDDIEKEDLEHYSQSLHTDPEFFESLYREVCISSILITLYV